MACEADIADKSIERMMDAARSKISTRQEVEATGQCLYCDADVPANRRWCDADCRDAWEAAKRRK